MHQAVTGDGEPLPSQRRRAQRSYAAERYAAELSEAADERHADPAGWRRYLAGHQERLAGLDSVSPDAGAGTAFATQNDISIWLAAWLCGAMRRSC